MRVGSCNLTLLLILVHVVDLKSSPMNGWFLFAVEVGVDELLTLVRPPTLGPLLAKCAPQPSALFPTQTSAKRETLDVRLEVCLLF